MHFLGSTLFSSNVKKNGKKTENTPTHQNFFQHNAFSKIDKDLGRRGALVSIPRRSPQTKKERLSPGAPVSLGERPLFPPEGNFPSSSVQRGWGKNRVSGAELKAAESQGEGKRGGHEAEAAESVSPSGDPPEIYSISLSLSLRC